MKRISEPVLVTGGAGFIGSHMVDELISNDYEIHVLDNLSNGNSEYLNTWKKNNKFKFIKKNLLDGDLTESLNNYPTIFHFAANPEVRIGTSNPEIHFRQNIVATFNLLEALRQSRIEMFVFMSTSTVYGEPFEIPTKETYGPLQPISTYGSTKLSCESLISGYAHTFDFKARIYRLANIIGERSTHGIIFDFISKLKQNPKQLEILGDGTQNKSYLYVSDCIEGIKQGIEHAKGTVEIFNIGSEDRIDVKSIAKIVKEEMNLQNTIEHYTGGVDGGRGWKGDVKEMLLDISKLKSLGWEPAYNSYEAVKLTIKRKLNQRNY